jgi:hypothetical protein
MHMKVDWRAVSHIGAAIVNQVVPGVAVAEQLAWQFGTMRGADKADAVVTMANNVLLALQSATGKQLADNARVDKAIRAVVSAIVALHQVIAEETAVPSL